jgi:hypothetical protein
MLKYIIAVLLISSVSFADAVSTVDNVTANAGIEINYPAQPDHVTTEGKGYRSFAMTNDFPIAQAPQYFGPVVPSHNFQSVVSILKYSNSFTKDLIDKITKKVKVDKKRITSDTPYLYPRITVYCENIPKEIEGQIIVKGWITAYAKDKKTLSVDVLMGALKTAFLMGGNVVVITAEGVDRSVKAGGWGVGLNNTSASMSSMEGNSNISSGGMGISSGKSGYQDKPWIQLTVLEIK